MQETADNDLIAYNTIARLKIKPKLVYDDSSRLKALHLLNEKSLSWTAKLALSLFLQSESTRMRYEAAGFSGRQERKEQLAQREGRRYENRFGG